MSDFKVTKARIANRYTSLIALIVFTAFLFSACSLASAESLKVGVIVPQTGSAALMGESLNGVVKLARLQHVAAVFEDDRCEAKHALAAYTKLRLEGIHVFYMACSGSILAVAPLAKKNGDLILTSYAGSAEIRRTGDEVVRVNPDAISVADGMSKLLVKEMLPTVVLFEEQDYAKSLVDRLKQLLGSEILESLSYRPEAPTFATEILKLKQLNAKSITVVPVGDGAARIILKQIAQNRITSPIIGDVNLCDYPFHPKDFGLKGRCVSARFSGVEYDRFLDQYAQLVGHPPAYPFYDAMALDLFLKVDAIGVSTQQVTDVKSEILKGFVGRFATYKFSSTGEAENGGDYLTKIES